MISMSAEITHLNLSQCTKLTGAEAINFLTTHPTVNCFLVYLNIMSNSSQHWLLEEKDMDVLLLNLTFSLCSLNLGGAKITSNHMPILIQLSKHLDELGLNFANLTMEDINSFFIACRR